MSLPTDRGRSTLFVICLAALCTGCVDHRAAAARDSGGPGAQAADAGASDGCPRLTLYADSDRDGVGHGDPVCADSLTPGLAEYPGDCEPTDPERVHVYYRDADGDGYGDQEQSICAGKNMRDGFTRASLMVDCDDQDPLRNPWTYERFDDGIDSDCNGADDPISESLPCSCFWLAAPAALQVETACERGFDPEDAAATLATLDLAHPACESGPDLALVLVAQCPSACAGGPAYFAVANRGAEPSTETQVLIEGKFRASPPRVPLLIPALDAGAHSALIALNATGSFTLRIEAQPGECELDENEVALEVVDYHCGFFP